MSKHDENYYLQLSAFKVTTACGRTWTTSMAKGITLADAEKYFLGRWFNIGNVKDHMVQAIKVEQIR